jgi:Sulfotransferase family
MIVSHLHRFIFVKRPKTAGTSIEIVLSPLCGPDDVVTPLNQPEKGHEARNYESFQKLPPKFLEHLPAWFLAEYLSDYWNRYFTFCVERNPWDKLVSAYHFHLTRPNVKPDLSFNTFLPFGMKAYGARDYADDEGRVLVDRVLRYEHLEAELAAVFDRLGIPFSGDLRARAKGRYRPPNDDYRSYYDSSTREMVARNCAWEIDRFGYTF